MSQYPIEPSPNSADPKTRRVNRLRAISRLLDNAVGIPGTSYRVGIDPLLGLLPGAGDFLGTAFSAYIVVEAAMLGLPRESLTRMVLNILLETLVGVVPVVGDFFDVAWKANTKNMALLDAHLAYPQQSQKADWWFIALLLGGLLLVVIAVASFSLFIMSLLWRALSP